MFQAASWSALKRNKLKVSKITLTTGRSTHCFMLDNVHKAGKGIDRRLFGPSIQYLHSDLWQQTKVSGESQNIIYCTVTAM